MPVVGDNVAATLLPDRIKVSGCVVALSPGIAQTPSAVSIHPALQRPVTRGASLSPGIAQAHPAVSGGQPLAKKRAARGTACTFNGKRPPKCPVRLAAHMSELEKHKSAMKQKAEAKKAVQARKKEPTPNQLEYRQHFVMQMKNRDGNARERLKQTAAAWRCRHESLRAAAE